MTNQTADIVVVGGGVIGASTAMHLALMGAGRVVLVERGHPASGASGLSGAMVREHYLHPVLVSMAMEARGVFQNFTEVIGGEAGFRQTGRLQLFPQHDEAAVHANVAMNRDLGVNIETLSPSDASRIVPQLDVDGIAVCVYEPDAGYADPVATTYAYVERARSLGAEVRTETPVTGLVVSGGRVMAVETATGRIEAGAVVVAAGSRSNRLIGNLAEPLPIVPARVQMAHFGRPPALESLSAIVIDRSTGAYLREDAGRGTLVGAEGPGDLIEVEDPDDIPLNADHEVVASLWHRATLRFPDFAAATCRGGYSAHYDMTPDANPIIDQSPSAAGLFWAAGFSGHGFKLSPVVGRMVAELVLQGECEDHPIERFRLSRFAEGDLLLAEHPYRGTSHQ